MRRIAWIALGAVGGILAYRSGQRFIADARERGIAASAQQAGASAWATAQAAAGLVANARDLAGRALAAQDAARAPGEQGQGWPSQMGTTGWAVDGSGAARGSSRAGRR